ncbi:MAG TPA: ATP-binding protein [Jatrophihabitans sp.]|nr:ATP-binding protein [Jatrophihabitans sp.]
MTDTRPEIGTTRTAAVGNTATPDWLIVRPAGQSQEPMRVPRLRTVLLQLAVAAAVVVVAVAVVGVLVSRRAAENESVRDAAELTNVLADTVVQPALTDAMATSTAAAATLDRVIRDRVLPADSLVRVKIWSPQGQILYSDEPRLVGRTFDLEPDARNALSHPQVSAAISDLDEPENQYERGSGTLLEVHRPVWAPSGRPLLFETYFSYNQVIDRAGALWRGFAAITLGSIGVLVILLVPLTWTLLLRARRAQRQREQMMQRTMDASADERRRIAATLHDGVVQDLVAASFAVSGGAQEAHARALPDLENQLREAADAVRSGIGAMRSLLVDIYPPNLHDAGLTAALTDLAAGLRLDVRIVIDERATDALDRTQTEAVFRVAQEALRNAAVHAHAGTVALTLHRENETVVLEVGDDGIGFDPATRPEGHFGLSLLDDVARTTGAELALRTAPGAGTTWRLRMPVAVTT